MATGLGWNPLQLLCASNLQPFSFLNQEWCTHWHYKWDEYLNDQLGANFKKLSGVNALLERTPWGICFFRSEEVWPWSTNAFEQLNDHNHVHSLPWVQYHPSSSKQETETDCCIKILGQNTNPLAHSHCCFLYYTNTTRRVILTSSTYLS